MSSPESSHDEARVSADEGQRTPTFADLGLDARVLKALADVGYETPSPIQAQTIPPLLEGRDVVGLAQTGTGKTAAFALPILSQLDLGQKTPQALVLAPTRELALQVSEAFEKYAAHLKGVHVLPVYGGQGYGVQLSALRRGVHIVVGTPGRIMDHLEKGTLDLSRAALPRARRGRRDAQDGLRRGRRDDPRRHPRRASRSRCSRRPCPRRSAGSRRSTSPTPTRSRSRARRRPSANTTQRYLMVSYPQKVDALTRILEVENFEGMIVFVRTKNETETLAEKLRARGYSAMAINGDVAQVQRERTVNQLKAGKLDILVATDVAARGLDVERISHVVNYDIPTDTESYVHRIGRTGRAGRSGDAISFVTPRERYLLKRDREGHPPAADADAAAHASTTSTSPAWPASTTRSPRRWPAGPDRRSSATSSRTTSASTTCPRWTSPPRSPSSLQGDEPLLLDPAHDQMRRPPPSKDRGPRDDRGTRGSDRGPRKERPSRAGSGGPMATYRIAVGKRHKVEPRQIVGALANEGGLSRGDFGRIDDPARLLARRAAGRPVRRHAGTRCAPPGSPAS